MIHRRTAPIGLGAALLAALLTGLVGCAQQTDGRKGWRTAAVDRGLVQVSISATGSLRALSTVDVGTQVSGQVESVAVDFNDRVVRGQEIARIDAANFRTRLTQAEADLASARANLVEAQAALKLAEAELQRKMELAGRKLISGSELDIAQAARDQAMARVGSARAAVRQREAAVADAALDVEYTVIRSPVDGVVLLRSVEPGQTVAASFQTPVLFRIAEDLTRMQIDLSIDEADVGQIRPGLPVRFTVDAYPNRHFEGKVHQVRLAATTLNNVVTYPVVVEVNNEDESLLPGMTANAEIEVASRRNVLRVPNAALRFKPEGMEAPRTPWGAGDGMAEDLPKIAAGLGLDAGQQQKLAAVIEGFRARAEQRRQAMAGRGGGAPAASGGGTAPTPEQIAAFRERMRQSTLAALAPFRESLSEDQRARFDAELDQVMNARRVTVWVLEGKQPKAVSVRVGVSDSAHTEVLSGLDEGTLVIVGAGS